jgi:hypothetical protein
MVPIPTFPLPFHIPVFPPKYALLEMVRLVVEALVRVELVEVSVVIIPVVEYKFVAVNPVEDAVVNVDCPVTLSVPVAVMFPPKYAFPCTERSELGVVVPIPTFPDANIVRTAAERIDPGV